MEQVIDRHRERILDLHGVEQIALGLSATIPGKECIRVHVSSTNWPDGLDRSLHGYDVEIIKPRVA